MSVVPFNGSRLRFSTGTGFVVAVSTTSTVRKLDGDGTDFAVIYNATSVPLFYELGTSASLSVTTTTAPSIAAGKREVVPLVNKAKTSKVTHIAFKTASSSGNVYVTEYKEIH